MSNDSKKNTAVEAVEVQTVEETAVVEKKYTIRPLCSDDIFSVCAILKKIGVKEFKAAFSSPAITNAIKSGNVDVESIGVSVVFDLVDIVVTNLPVCKDELYSFLGSVTGQDSKEIGKLPLVEFGELLIDVIGSDDFKDFFKLAQRFLK